MLKKQHLFECDPILPYCMRLLVSVGSWWTPASDPSQCDCCSFVLLDDLFIVMTVGNPLVSGIFGDLSRSVHEEWLKHTPSVYIWLFKRSCKIHCHCARPRYRVIAVRLPRYAPKQCNAATAVPSRFNQNRLPINVYAQHARNTRTLRGAREYGE